MKKITEIGIIDTEAWNNENNRASFDAFEKYYQDLESKVLKKIFKVYFDEDYPYLKDSDVVEFHIMPFYDRIISYNGKVLGTIKMLLKPIQKDLHIIVEFNPST